MKANDVMTRDVATCRPEDPMAEAARIMWERDCGVVPVVDGEGRVAGIVTDRDICMAAFTRNEPLSRMAVRDAMAKRVFTCRSDDDVSSVHAAMRSHQVRRLPVVDGEGRLQGIITLNDLALRAAGKTFRERHHHDVEQTLGEISRHRETAAAV